MPWKETGPMDERERLVEMALRSTMPMTAVCEVFGVSRKTGYKWLERYRDLGRGGLVDQSRAPHVSPQAMKASMARVLVRVRKEHPQWGPRKILAYLDTEDPGRELPAASSVGDLYKREGLVKQRRRRKRVPPSSERLENYPGPNGLWCADFKGDFLLGNRNRCYPLTATDQESRFLLESRALKGTKEEPAWDVFEELFREYGLPMAIRTDNGVPFANKGGLSRLSVKWTKLGIRHQRTEPGHPEQNGRHERMHRTLKAETATPPKANEGEQQKAFDNFREEFNWRRPHEALGQRTPGSVYQSSPRRYPRRMPEVKYSSSFEVRVVNGNGSFKFLGQRIFMSEALEGEPIGLEARADGLWIIWFGFMRLGFLDTTSGRVERHRGPPGWDDSTEHPQPASLPPGPPSTPSGTDAQETSERLSASSADPEKVLPMSPV